MLSVLLDRHSKIAVTPETGFFLYFFPNKMFKFRSNSHKVSVQQVLKKTGVDNLGIDSKVLLSSFLRCKPTLKNLFKIILKLYAIRAGKRTVIEKSTVHLPCVGKIFKWYPDAKVICIIRDGRDVVNSLLKVPWASDNILIHCAMWNFCALLAKKYSSEFPQSFKIVKYEDLVENPENVLKEICDLINETFEPTQLDRSCRSDAVPKWEYQWKGKALEKLDATRIHAWRDECSVEKQIIMTHLMGRWLTYYGYNEFNPKSAKRNKYLLVKVKFRLVYEISYVYLKYIIFRLIY